MELAILCDNYAAGTNKKTAAITAVSIQEKK
jgi:hypothetical protein